MGRTHTNRGFTLIELLVSLAVGMIVIGAAVQLFSQGMAATFVVSQRAEMQQDVRAASNLLVKDIGLAGAGMPSGQSVALPSGTGTNPIYGCDQAGNCMPGGGIAYPCSTGLVPPCIPTLYSIIPGFRLGITVPGNPTPTDVITVVYSDTVFALPCYNVTFPGGVGVVNPVTFTLPAIVPPSCLPAGLPAPQAVNNNVVGLQPGDLVLFTNTPSGQAIAEVSNVAPGGGPPYTVNFLNADPLQLNQSGAASGDLAQIVGGANTTATRIFVITYFLRMLPDPLGVGPGIPVLMRQVNGHTAVPVAENVVNLQFTYDTYDANGVLLNEQGNAGYPATQLNLIRKINITHLTIRSQRSGVGSVAENTRGYQSFDFQTSMSARNLSYQNRYF